MSTKVRLSAAIVHCSICAIDLPAEILSAREKDPPEKGMSQGGSGKRWEGSAEDRAPMYFWISFTTRSSFWVKWGPMLRCSQASCDSSDVLASSAACPQPTSSEPVSDCQ